MLGHFLQFPQGDMNMCYKKENGQTSSNILADLRTLKNEQVCLFHFVGSLEISTKYNLGGNKATCLYRATRQQTRQSYGSSLAARLGRVIIC